MGERIDSRTGPVIRGAARVRGKGAAKDAPWVDVLTLTDAAGRTTLCVFTAAAVFDGVPRKTGQLVPLDFRTSVLTSALRMGRVAPCEPPPDLHIDYLADDEAEIERRMVRTLPPGYQPEQPAAAPPLKPRPEPPAKTRPKPAPPEPPEPEPEQTDDGTAVVDDDDGSYAAGAADVDAPAWHAVELGDEVSQHIMRKLKKANIKTAGELERYANDHKGELAGLELSDGQQSKLIDAMARITAAAGEDAAGE